MNYLNVALAFSLLCAPVFALSFQGYPCTSDCSGHEAGYEWAMEKGITDQDDCGGNSNSFIEGCRAAAEEDQGYDDFEEDESENREDY